MRADDASAGRGGGIGAAENFQDLELRGFAVLGSLLEMDTTTSQSGRDRPKKIEFVVPPSGPGVKGSDLLPEFGSEECYSRSRIRTVAVDCQQDEDGRWFADNPFTGKRKYSAQAQSDVFEFKTLP
jgi:hypothetical protein